MNRHDIVKSAEFYREGLRREARARAKRYPEIAEQLNRLADAVDRQIAEMRCGPLFADRPEASAL